MNLRTFDLNLLLVFDAILRERSVMRAAEALGLSQPALSHALNRLRYLVKDQLFVRTPAGVMPTPRAEQLALPVRKALNDLQIALETETFSPSTADRQFVIAVNNYAAVVLAAPIVAACRAAADRRPLCRGSAARASGLAPQVDFVRLCSSAAPGNLFQRRGHQLRG